VDYERQQIIKSFNTLIKKAGHDYMVIAPSLIPQKMSGRVKTHKRGANK